MDDSQNMAAREQVSFGVSLIETYQYLRWR